MDIVEALRSRFRPEWKTRADTAGLDRMFETALSFIEAPKLKHAALVKTGNLSARGLGEALRHDLGKDVVPELRRMRRDINARQEALKEERAGLAKPKVDASDLAAAMRRQELRTYFRGLESAERMKILLECPEANSLVAVLEMPPALSGLTAEMRTHAEQAFVEANHGPTLKAMDDRQEALDQVSAAVDVATMEVRNYVGLEGQTFDQWFSPADVNVLPATY